MLVPAVSHRASSGVPSDGWEPDAGKAARPDLRGAEVQLDMVKIL